MNEQEQPDLTLLADFIPYYIEGCHTVMPASVFGLKIGDKLPDNAMFLCQPCADERRARVVLNMPRVSEGAEG